MRLLPPQRWLLSPRIKSKKRLVLFQYGSFMACVCMQWVHYLDALATGALGSALVGQKLTWHHNLYSCSTGLCLVGTLHESSLEHLKRG